MMEALLAVMLLLVSLRGMQLRREVTRLATYGKLMKRKHVDALHERDVAVEHREMAERELDACIAKLNQADRNCTESRRRLRDQIGSTFDSIDRRHIRLDVGGPGFNEKCACIPESDWNRLGRVIRQEE